MPGVLPSPRLSSFRGCRELRWVERGLIRALKACPDRSEGRRLGEEAIR